MILYCYDCGQENHDDRKFCKSCGKVLSIRCQQCDFENQFDAKFCGGCGKEITRATPNNREAERRQLTVMFCDLVGSTELAERFDPEILRDLLRAFQQAVANVILKYGGHIAKYIGDGLLVYFGHPHAHEDDVRRSILAGLGIIEEISHLNSSLKDKHDIQLEVRIGIHTGLVVIGQMGSGTTLEENAIVGETPNIAARIESLAKPNTVTISEDTYELTKGLFIAEERSFKPLKGITQDIKIYEVTSESSFLSEFDVRVQQGLTPMVGRSKELDFLTQCWMQVKNGLGQVVWLSGEAGVGKSRIVNEFMSNISHDPQHLRLYYCSSVHSNSAFYPIMTHLKRLVNFKKDDSDEFKYKSLKSFLSTRALALGNVAPLLAPLLGIKPAERIHNATPEKFKLIIIESWLGLMKKMAEDRPLLLIFEDTHWVDPSTQELIGMLCKQIAKQRILLLVTSRPGYQIPEKDSFPLQSLTLNRLDKEASSVMVRQFGGQRTLPDDLVNELVTKTDGIPLFIEELTKAVMDSGLLMQKGQDFQLSAPLETLSIPNSLKDSLMARLDQLSAVKNVAQIAATIGRRFSAELLESLDLYSPSVIRESINKLLETHLIFVSDEIDRVHYQFSHALIQETAYQSLLKSTRKRYHGLIADTIIRQFPSVADTEPEILAQHYTQAGKTELAVSYWLAAGKKANRTSSHNEAVSHFTKGIELLNTLPESNETNKLEFQIQIRLIAPLIAAKSYVSPDVEKAFTRALELSRVIDISHEIFPALSARYAFYQVCGLINEAKKLVDEFYAIAELQHVEYPELELVGNRMRGASMFLLGEALRAQTYLKRSIDAYDYGKHKNILLLYGQDSKVAALSYLTLAQWHAGQVHEACQSGKDAIEHALTLSSANTTGVAYFMGCAVLQALLGNPEEVLVCTDILTDLANDQEMPLWQATGTFFKGWALVHIEQKDQGMIKLDEGLAAYNVMKLGLFKPLILLLYADACKQTNLMIKGIKALDEALEFSKQAGEHWLDAEIHRFRGELQFLKPKKESSLGQQDFQKALVIAREQQSPTQELRILMSMLEYADIDQDIDDIETQLRNVYNSFNDNQNFNDLSRARQLLGIT